MAAGSVTMISACRKSSAVNVLLARGSSTSSRAPLFTITHRRFFLRNPANGYLELERVVTAAVFPRMAAVHHQGGHRTGPVETDEHTLAAPLRTGLQITEIVAYPAGNNTRRPTAASVSFHVWTG